MEKYRVVLWHATGSHSTLGYRVRITSRGVGSRYALDTDRRLAPRLHSNHAQRAQLKREEGGGILDLARGETIAVERSVREVEEQGERIISQEMCYVFVYVIFHLL